MKTNTFRILLLGPRTNRKHPEQTGGAVVLFENLIEQCQKNNIDYHVIDTNKKNYSNLIVAYIAILWQLIWVQRPYTHITLHSSRDYIILSLAVIFFGKLFGKKVSLRKFGGEAANVFINANIVKKILLYSLFKNMDQIFLEMKYLVTFFSKINPNTYWFPNVRRRIVTPIIPRSFSKKFAFIGHVKSEKGIDELLEASNQFDDSFTFDIFGIIENSKYTDEHFKKYHAKYKGSLQSDEVLHHLNEYDVLILPSYKEGYPGIMIEAYSLGIPVIATALPGIKEITEDHQTGILITPKNIDELVQAIRYFDEINYPPMSISAYNKFHEFDADIQTQHFFEQIGIK
jgi:glycosyltransferase involved in cell wall biosynthesis